MQFRIYALQNTKDQLVESASTTDDNFIALTIRDKYLARDLIVVVEREYDNGDVNTEKFVPGSASKRKTIEQIALEHLSIDTLEERKSDSLDFHMVSVWGVKAALKEAVKRGVI